MNFKMINEASSQVWTGSEWMALKPEERLRLISAGRFRFIKTPTGEEQ